MKRTLITPCLYTLVTAVVVGIAYPLALTAIAQALFHDQANGQLITRDGQLLGSRILGQPFTGPKYFHSRPAAAGTGYDAGNSSGSNLAPTNKALVDRVTASVASEQQAQQPVPVDLVTASGSGLDPHITPAAAAYQVARVAHERGLTEPEVQKLVAVHTEQRQFGFLGEARVNVLELNLALDDVQAGNKSR